MIKKIFEIKEFPFFQYVIRLICLGWIIFAYSKFEINPEFFGSTIALSVIIIFTLIEKSVVASDLYLIIYRKRWFPFFNEEEKIYYRDIFYLHFEESSVDLGALLLNFLITSPESAFKRSKLVITNKDFMTHEVKSIGSEEEVNELIAIVEEKISVYNS